MAIRFTEGGLQSYDPLSYDPFAQFKKKKKETTVAPEPEPISEPISAPSIYPAPQPKIKTSVIFNPDTSVDVTRGDFSTRLTREEYDIYRTAGTSAGTGRIEGQITPNVQRLLDIEQAQQRMEREGITQKEFEEAQKEIPQQEIIPTLEEQQIAPPTLQALEEKEALKEFMKTRFFQPLGFSGVSASEEFIRNPSKEIGRAIDETIYGTSVGLMGTALITRGLSISTALKGITLKKLATIGGGIGIIKLQLITNQNILTKALAHLEQLNKDVADGNISYEVASAEYDIFRQQINSASSSIKWINSSSVLNFLSGGKDTAVLFENALRYDIPRLQRELEASRISRAQIKNANIQRLMQIKATYGVA